MLYRRAFLQGMALLVLPSAAIAQGLSIGGGVSQGNIVPLSSFGGLPGCGAGNKGQLYGITDGSTGQAYNSSFAGSSSTLIMGLCTSTAWVAH